MSIAMIILQAPAEVLEPALGPGALAFMLISMAAVTLLASWCFFRILRGRRHFDPDGTGPARPPMPGDVERRGKDVS